MSSLPIILIFTCPEYGQANVNLAASYELALSGVQVYIASFASLRIRVSRLQELIDRHALRSSGKTKGSVIFRELEGVTPYAEAVIKHGIDVNNMSHTPGLSGAMESYSKLDVIYLPCSQEEYLSAINSCKEVITTIKPNLVVVDTLFYSAMDACKLLDQKFMVIFPTGLKDAVVFMQPYMAALWKYPILSSGFSFPLEWWQIPLNIYLYIRLIVRMNTSANAKQIGALRRSLGLDNVFGVGRYSGVTYMCPALTEIDFPFTVIPHEILLCGPIIMPFDPLEESDPGLLKWLDNGPTVLVNLGSHMVAGEKLAKEMMVAFRMLLDHHGKKGGPRKIQVLWKTKADGDVQKMIDEIIREEIKEGRVRVVAWLDAEPVSILQHPNVVCTVHHGGANSFYEGVWSGIPHVVLPIWYDTYDYARLTEFLNIGIFGSKTSAPGVRAEELGKALVRVTGDGEEAGSFRSSARHLKEVCRAKGNGRELASVAILKEAGIRK